MYNLKSRVSNLPQRLQDDPLPIFMAQDSLSVTVYYVLNVSKNYVIENKTASFMSLLRLFYVFQH